MDSNATLPVKLSATLLGKLRQEARRLNLPLEWLVAALLVDAVEGEPAIAVA